MTPGRSTIIKILVADNLPESFVTALVAAGHECVTDTALMRESLPGALVGVEVLVVRSTEVTSKVLTDADSLRLVVRAGSGTNTIDCEAASARKILVANVPGRNAIAVAELTMGLLLATDRAIADNVAGLRAGRWDKRRFSQVGQGLYGRRIGIVGLGSIGMEVAMRAQAFGMHIAALNRATRSAETSIRVEQLGVRLFADMVELAEHVDVLTLHVPLSSQTENLVDAGVLDALAPGILINTSRAAVVDTDALVAHLDAGTLAAGLDVFPDEPSAGTADWDSPLARHPRVVGTHHIGASTEQAQTAVVEGALEIIAAFGRGELLNVVNATSATSATSATQTSRARE
ncbi:MAG: NAD(P)-dependent oxidoreductase [Nocardioidaceae bacterium]